MDKVGFVVVGLGMGSARAQQIAQIPDAKLVGVADLNAERAKSVGEKLGVPYVTDYRQFLTNKDVHVVMVMTPSGLHAEVGVEAARAGKHVLTTKPIESSLARADWLIDECRKAGVILACDFESRFVPDNVRIKRAIETGEFGRLLLGEARLKWFRSQQYYDGWHGTWRYDGGGSLINQTVHWIDLLQWYMGPVERVLAKVAVLNHKIETEDTGLAILEFRSGALGTILGTTTYPPNSGAEYTTIEIHGDRGLVVCRDAKIQAWKADPDTPFEYKGPKNSMEDMIEAIRQGRPPMVDGPEAKKSLEIVKAAYHSSFTGQPVSLPLKVGEAQYF